MFDKPTTFVIGAGCSREYNLPLGYGLRDEIVTLLKHVIHHKPGNSRDVFIWGSDRTDAAFNQAVRDAAQSNWREWFEKCQKMAMGLQHAESIDRFLDFHSETDEAMVTIGKMAISRRILRAEAESTLAIKPHERLDMAAISLRRGKDPVPHWLYELFLRLQQGVRRSQIDQILKNVTFICFNYDRVIEHYLFNAIRAFANLDTAETASVMKGLRIYHPYGRLGHLFWEDSVTPQGVHYGADLDDVASIIGMGKNLRIFTETIEDDGDISAIQASIQCADKIVFLGFSFLQQNLNLIRPATRSQASQVWATTCGMSTWDTEVATTAVSSMLNGLNSDGFKAFHVKTVNSTAGQFMADAGNLLRS